MILCYGFDYTRLVLKLGSIRENMLPCPTPSHGNSREKWGEGVITRMVHARDRNETCEPVPGRMKLVN